MNQYLKLIVCIVCRKLIKLIFFMNIIFFQEFKELKKIIKVTYFYDKNIIFNILFRIIETELYSSHFSKFAK